MDRFLMLIEPRRHKGFTLMEVLVALAVLAIALTTVFKLQGRTMVMSSKARFLNIAPQLATSKLAEVETLEFSDISDDSGVFGEAYPDYAWKLSIEEVPTDLIENKQYHLVRINVQIAQTDDHEYQLQTYRLYID